MRARRVTFVIVAALAACAPLDEADSPEPVTGAFVDAAPPGYRWPPPIEDQPRLRVLFHLDAGPGAPP